MQTLGIRMPRWIRTGALAATVLGGLGISAWSAPAEAHYGYQCQRRIEHAECKLEEAIQHHGYYSRQADHWRYKLREERERCYREREEYRERYRYRDRDDDGYRDRYR